MSVILVSLTPAVIGGIFATEIESFSPVWRVDYYTSTFDPEDHWRDLCHGDRDILFDSAY